MHGRGGLRPERAARTAALESKVRYDTSGHSLASIAVKSRGMSVMAVAEFRAVI